MLGSFFSDLEERTATMVFGLVLALGDGLPSEGRPAPPLGRSSGFAGDSSILNYYCSQRACTLEKGAGEAGGKLLSQLSFSVYAGQVVFRSGTTAELRQGELGDTEEFL